MNTQCVELAPGMRMGPGARLVVIAGPCVIEAEAVCFRIAGHLQEVCGRLGLPYVFKASFDKANRTSVKSFRGLGLHDGLAILGRIRERFKVPVLTDVHESDQAASVAAVVDVLQIPAFLCRQTDLIVAAAKTGRAVNVKKGQFLAPDDCAQIIAKCRGAGNSNVLLTERGTTFGYHNLVVDFRSLPMMRALGAPVIYDATHSLQLPGGLGKETGGARQYAPALARAAAAVGVDGYFLEVHDDPANAKSDRATQLPLAELEGFLSRLLKFDALRRETEG